jgi:hypothetical protein
MNDTAVVRKTAVDDSVAIQRVARASWHAEMAVAAIPGRRVVLSVASFMLVFVLVQRNIMPS